MDKLEAHLAYTDDVGPCLICGLTIDQHRRVDTPDGPEFLCPRAATNGHAAEVTPRKADGKKPYKLVLARDVTIEGTAKSFLIDGFLGRDETSIWYGPPECGKSTVKIDAACHVATGRPWCGRAVMRGPVLYVAAERGQTVKRRVLAWRLEHGIEGDEGHTDIPRRLHRGTRHRRQHHTSAR
jgi:hypothetical protein